MIKKYGSLALWIALFELVSFSIGMLTQAEIDTWYKTLIRPPMVPPDFVFPVVWTALYALIAAAGWALWRGRHSSANGRYLLFFFAAYMALNWSWSFIFFGAHELLVGFIWIIAMNVLALAIICQSWEKQRLVALLMIPPTLWTIFASYLNGAYWILNSSP